MLAFVFPGQGSQKKGMGAGLFDEVREFTAVEREVDALLGYSLRSLCLEDANNTLKDTQYTQPALYTVNALHYYKAISEGLKPNFAAGHSLGEYDALLAAGVFDYLTGLKLVKKRGELMAHAKGGGMAAVVGLTAERIVEVTKSENLGGIDVANFNSPTQIVVSGPVEEVRRSGPLFEKAGARMVVPLQVSAAFHSRYMADAAKVFADFLAPVKFESPKIPVIANVTSQPYPAGGDAAKALLVKQIASSVQWTQSVGHLVDSGATEFKEIGPGNVLTKLIQQIRKA